MTKKELLEKLKPFGDDHLVNVMVKGRVTPIVDVIWAADVMADGKTVKTFFGAIILKEK